MIVVLVVAKLGIHLALATRYGRPTAFSNPLRGERYQLATLVGGSQGLHEIRESLLSTWMVV